MTFAKIKKILDQFSPYPVLYPLHMSEKETELFDRTVRNSSVHLEFGLGGSTLRALLKTEAAIYTVESNPVWIAYMRRYLVFRYHENKRLFITHADIGPTKRWGYPESDAYRDKFPDYSSHVFEIVDGETVDTVFVDGRFRVACVLKIILECCENERLRILIHDFWSRKEYHIVLKYLHTEEREGSMGLFSVRENVDLQSVAADYETYKTNPD